MKVFNKYFVIALLLSLIFSVSAVAAQENMTFEQSDIDETLTVSPYMGEINAVEEESVNANNELLQVSEDNQLTAGEGSFSDVQSKIDQATNGSTVYLDGKTYVGNGKNIEIKKDLTIVGGSESDPNQFATLDAKELSSIIDATRNGTNIVLKYIKFINGKSEKNNGAAINSNSNLVIENCKFTKNVAEFGGALYLNGFIYHVVKQNDPSWESFNDTYTYYPDYHYEINNPPWDYMEWYYPPSNPYPKNRYYYDDETSDLYIRENFTNTLINCEFSDNIAIKAAGSIYFNGDTYGGRESFIMRNSTFTNNKANYAAAISFTGFADIQYTKFNNNVATTHAGAISGYQGSIIRYCNFTSNHAGNSGGAIYSPSGFDVDYCNFEFNNASSGGAIFVNAGSRINNCNFTSNSATNNGGAIESRFNSLYVNYCNFEFNNASSGGAVYQNSNSGKIQYCNFTSNHATGFGGATYQSTVELSNFNNNNALKGGAAYSGTMRSCNFTSNSATEGGAVYSSYVYTSNFISNRADYGGAIYCTGNYVHNSNFSNNIALDSSKSIYISYIYSFTYIKGNNFKSEDTEIVIRKINDYNGLNIVILHNQTVEFCEGEIKIFASVSNNEGTKFSIEEFIFLVGSHEVNTKVIDNYAEVKFNVTPDDNNSVISVKTSSSTSAKISTAFLNVYPYVVYIDFDDAHGYIGKFIQIPVYVHDSTGHPVVGSIFVNYNGDHSELQLKNGKADVVMQLPNKKITLDLIVEYKDVVEVRKIKVLDPDDPIAVIIEMPENETGHVGRTVTVPINLHDGLGNQLKGDIHVSYLGHEETITLINGQTDILISLPVYETCFDLVVSYKGYNAFCSINVIDPTVKANSTIYLPHGASGNIGESIKVPVKVVDDEGNPLEGNISISYMGKELSQALNSAGETEIIINLPNHEVSFELVVNYKGNIKSCIIEARDSTNHTNIVIDVNESYNGVLGKNITVPIKITDVNGNALGGNVSISYNGHFRTQTLENGQTEIFIELPAMETSFDLIISYKGHVEIALINSIYEGAHINAMISLPNNKTENIGKVIQIPVKVTDSEGNPLQGDVAVYYAGNEFTQTLVNGSTAIVIDPIDYQTSFELTVAYHAQMAHCFVSVINPNIKPVDAVISLPETESGHVGKTIVIPVSVSDSEGNPLEGEIGIYYDVHMTSETLHNGNASIVMLLPDEPTSYNLTVMYKGVSKNCLITVKDASDDSETNDTEVVIELNDEYIGHAGKLLNIPVSVHDGKGNALEGKITILYNHQKIEHTLNNGATNILIALPANPTTFELAVEYEGLTKIATIRVIDSSNPMGDITEVTTNGTGSIVIPMPSDATGEVNVTIAGKVYPGKIVDGKIIVNITDLPNGTYTATVNYSGDENYSASQKVITIIIKDSTVEDPNSPLANVTEAKTNGDGTVEIPFPKDATGDVIVTIDGKNYTGKIIDGKVVLDIADLPAGNYTSIVYYPGDGNYPSTIKTIVIVKDASSASPTNPMGDTTQAQSNDDGSINIPFPKDATGEVLVEIDGQIYTGRIVDGKVVLDVGNMPAGNHNANVYYFGDGKYGASSRTMVFIIKETTNNNNNQNTPVKPPAAAKKASKITAKKKTFKKSLKAKKYSITLKSGKTPIKKVQVTIKVGKKTYKAKTNAKGKATFKINKLTKKGKYTAVIKYKGDKTYKAATKKVKITVK